MADDPEQLLANNRAWATQVERDDPGFFHRLTTQQRPQYLWIGCSDSRVPANQITGLPPGEVFVHRNVANVVLHTDLNCLSVVEFAVKVLKVRHIIVCGHYGCSGVTAAIQVEKLDLVDNWFWLRGIRDLYKVHRDEFAGLDQDAAVARMCEMNVHHQLRSLCHTRVVREAWKVGQPLTVHGWIYSIEDGLLRDLGTHVDAVTDLATLDRFDSWT
jgi:carbonic anhydrase